MFGCTNNPLRLFSPLSLSPHLSLCLSWRPAVLDVSLQYECYRFFSLAHKQQSFCSSSVSKAPLFQRHMGGAWTKHSQTTLGWDLGSIAGRDSYWFVKAPAWRIVGSKGACYTHPVKVAGEKDTAGNTMRRRPLPVSTSPATTVAQEVTRTPAGELCFPKLGRKGQKDKKKKKEAYLKCACVWGVVCVSVGNGTTHCGWRRRNGKREAREASTGDS